MDAEIIPLQQDTCRGIGLCQMDTVALFNSRVDADQRKQQVFAVFKVNQVIESRCTAASPHI